MQPRCSGSDVPPIAADHLVRLGQRGQRVRRRHLAGLVALQPHAIQDFPSGKAARVVLDDLHQGFALAASTSLRSRASTAGLSGGGGSLAALGSFVGINRSKLPINVGQLTFKLVLLVENLLALSVQSLALPGNKVGK